MFVWMSYDSFKVTNPSKLRVDIRLFGDLVAVGVFPSKEGLSLLGGLISLLIAGDGEDRGNAGFILSFCRHCGEDYAGNHFFFGKIRSWLSVLCHTLLMWFSHWNFYFLRGVPFSFFYQKSVFTLKKGVWDQLKKFVTLNFLLPRNEFLSSNSFERLMWKRTPYETPYKEFLKPTLYPKPEHMTRNMNHILNSPLVMTKDRVW